jgi:hypothetical protein
MTYAQLLREFWTANATHEDRIQLLRFFWKIGDPSPIAEWLGIKYVPPLLPDDLDLNDELRLTVEHARMWIADVHKRLYAPVSV